MPFEFDCTDCGRHIVDVIADKPPYGCLCAQCIHLPGWHLDPKLVAMLDPTLPIPKLDRGG